MVVKLTHKIAIQLHLVAGTICSSRSRRPVRKLLDTPSYSSLHIFVSHNKDIKVNSRAHVTDSMEQSFRS